MTAAEFMVILRRELGDPVRIVPDDQLWTDTELLQYINESCYEFARRTHYFADSSSSITSIPVVASNQWIDISDRILRVRRAKLMLARRPLRVVDSVQMDDFGGNWDADLGTPRMLMLGEEINRARFDRIPQVSDTLRIAVFKLPDALLTPANAIAVPEQYVRKLLPGVRSQAYGKQDADTFDANKALGLGNEFQGELTKIKRELLKLRRRSTASRYRGPL